MEDEKYPMSLSSVQLNDFKQLPGIMSSRLHSIQSEQSVVNKADPQVIDFLTSLGASLFAHATPKRVLRVSQRTLTELGAIYSSDMLHNEFSPIHKFKPEHRAPRREVRHLTHASSHHPPLSTIPSHRVNVEQTSRRTTGKSEDFCSKRTISDLKADLAHKKHEHVVKKRGELQAQIYEKAMLRAQLRNDRSHRIRKEAQLMKAAVTGLSNWILREKDTVMGSVKIVVIGGGLAGLSAVDKLIEMGFRNVLLLEASDRLGGRIHTLPVDDSQGEVLEMGSPSLDNCGSDNTVYSLAAESGLLAKSSREPRYVFEVLRADGTKVREDTARRASRLCRLFEKDIELVSTVVDGPDGRNKINLPFKSYIAERRRRFEKESLASSRGGKPSDLHLAINSLAECSVYPISDIAEDTAVQWLGKVFPDKERIILKAGMSSLINELTKRFGPDTVHLKAHVSNINWSAVDGEERKPVTNSVEVVCAGGKRFTANHVVVAVPLGYLKKNAPSMFEPALPADKCDAIHRMGYGTVSKVFFCYRSPISDRQISFIWPGSPETMFRNKLKVTSASPKILRIASIGHNLEDVPEQDIIDEVTRSLRSFLNTDVPAPHRIVKTNWHGDSLFCGTHPYMNTESRPKDIKALEMPLFSKADIPLVLFAGDYTYDNYVCLMHAARASGLREAHRIENIYNRYFGYQNICR